MTKSSSKPGNPFTRTLPLTREFSNIPLIGMLNLTDADADPEYQIGDSIRNFQTAGKEFVTLVINDNSMRQAGIIKGDYLTVNLNSNVQDGDLTVVRLGERLYVRQFFRQSSTLIRLQTCDEFPAVLVIETKTPDFEIIGRVYSLSRQF
jgi:SOS-response transcriptional repressor LexA